jgi:ornithine carbamoyltransferase
MISIGDLSIDEIEEIFKLTKGLKEGAKRKGKFAPLADKTLAMIFNKPSTRTRVSFASGMYQLRGQVLFLSGNDLQLGRGETIADTARTLSRYVDGIVIRTYDHREVLELAKYASIPVINGLTDLLHPCQVLSDIYTITEKLGAIKGLKLAYVGDGNNVCNSWLYGASKFGMNLTVACPVGYEPDGAITEEAKEEGLNTGSEIKIIREPELAAQDADIIYTDVWASMGEEQEVEIRQRVFQPYQVNQALVDRARENCLVMHCLPAHRGQEITSDVIDGPHSIVFDQAENRLHLQKAILVLLMGSRKIHRFGLFKG